MKNIRKSCIISPDTHAYRTNTQYTLTSMVHTRVYAIAASNLDAEVVDRFDPIRKVLISGHDSSTATPGGEKILDQIGPLIGPILPRPLFVDGTGLRDQLNRILLSANENGPITVFMQAIGTGAHGGSVHDLVKLLSDYRACRITFVIFTWGNLFSELKEVLGEDLRACEPSKASLMRAFAARLVDDHAPHGAAGPAPALAPASAPAHGLVIPEALRAQLRSQLVSRKHLGEMTQHEVHGELSVSRELIDILARVPGLL